MMLKILCLLFVGSALAGLTEGINRVILNPQDKYDVETTEYLSNINNAIYTVSQNVSDTPSLFQMIIAALHVLNESKTWLPCASDITTVLGAVENGLSEMWALNMIDAGTKLPSGLLRGNIVDLGQYDECINAQGGNITGQHCLINFIFKLPKADTSATLKMLGGSLTLTMAQCFPSSCEPHLLRSAFGEIADLLSFMISSTNVSVSVEIPDTDCHTQYSRLGPDATEITILTILVVLVVIVSAMTVIDYMLLRKRLEFRKPSKGELAVQAFSVYTNGQKLFSLQQNPEQMNCLSGMKFLSIGWVAIGHRYRFAVTVPLVNLLRVSEMIETWSKMIILNAILSVDTFFLMSGLLNAYGFCIVRDKIKGFGIFNVIHSLIHRYIRLTPAYLVMIGMTATWIYRVGDGPLWDRMVGSERNSCRETFWANLIYLNNYLTPDNNCMMQSWYLAADMQMFWVSPFVIYPLWRWPIFGYIYILILTGLSVAAPVLVAYFYDIPTPIPVTTDPVEQSKEMDKLYFPTHTKTVAYVVGILLGYILYRIRVKKNMRVRMTKIAAVFGWILALVSMVYALFGGHYLYLSSKPYNLLESSLYIGFFRLFWSIGIAWVIFACCTGYGGLINSFLSLSIFGPLGRLSYCIYLTHIFMILYKFGSMRTAIFLSDYDMLQESMGEMVVIIVFATILSLVSESPIMTLEKLILGGGGGGNKRRAERNRAESLKKKTDEEPEEDNANVGSGPGGNLLTNPTLVQPVNEDVAPSAPIEVEIEPESLYPQVPDISSLDQLPSLTDEDREPPPYNPNNIYAQVIRNRTLSGDTALSIQESSTGPV